MKKYWKKVKDSLVDDYDIGIEFLLISNLGAFVIMFILVIIGVLMK